ncbi:DNA-processing protein DprA [Streptomyces sp. BI20]|uniref:DNA-processing protein DprA n=1 Tax=Streptomyces sp. BI20 TaxID=3403460 RepID=UPI003C77CD18
MNADPDTPETPEAPEPAECPEGPDEETLARAALTRVLEPGEAAGGRWLAAHGARALLDLLTGPEESAEAALTGVRAERLAGCRARARAADPHRDLALHQALGGRFVHPGTPEWPTQLDDLGDARPIGLWLRGRPHLRLWCLRAVAVVGARACTPYGAHVAGELGAQLAEHGWTLLSGGAYGIDAAAHRGALAAAGATGAVLACGLDTPYPRGHAELLARVADSGLLIGELPPGEHPTRARFITRNRVIAALSRGTVVVEAAHRSGSLSTARHALALGRQVMGVPGPVTSGMSAGVHELLRTGGGHLVTNAAEIVEMVGAIGELAPNPPPEARPRDLLDPDTARLLEAFSAGAEHPPHWLARASDTAPDEVIGRLYELHSLGFVERVGDRWRLARVSRARAAESDPDRRAAS